MTEPLGRQPLEALLEVALGAQGADEVEAVARRRWGGLCRFARSAIHQHVDGEDTTISVRVAVGGRVGTAVTNDASPEGVAAAAATAVARARLTPPDPSWPGVAPAGPLPRLGTRFDVATADAGPDSRAEAVAALVGRLRPGQEAAGAVSTAASEVAVATTAGARHHALTTRAAVTTVVMGSGGESGHSEDAAIGLDGLDPAGVGEEAAETCARAADPGDVEPGVEEVVLGPSAVMTLMEWLALTAFSAKALQEGRSPFSERMGEAVAADVVTIADDPLADGVIGLPFDDEGSPCTRVDLITEGVATGVVHDRVTAAAAGVPPTGHGLPAPNPWGPLARHLVLEPGGASPEELVAGVDRGLYVTRFWYTRAVNPKQTRVTGMTRDGTFRIEGGRLGPPVRNLRYNESILEALASCDGVGAALRTCSDELGDTRVPTIRLRRFSFTAVSDH